MAIMFAPLIASGLGALARLGPAAYRGYKTYKTARNVGGLGRFSKAAQPKSGGFPLGYQGTLAQRIVGTPSKGLGSGTGLQGLMARGAKKFPTTSAAIEGGSGALIGGQGRRFCRGLSRRRYSSNVNGYWRYRIRNSING